MAIYTIEEELLRSEKLGTYQGLIISLLRELEWAGIDNAGIQYIRKKYEETQKKEVDRCSKGAILIG